MQTLSIGGRVGCRDKGRADNGLMIIRAINFSS